MQSQVRKYLRDWGYSFCDEDGACVFLENGVIVDVERPGRSINITNMIFEDAETDEEHDYTNLLETANILNDGYVWHTKFYADEEFKDVNAMLEFDYHDVRDMAFKLHKALLLMERLPGLFANVLKLVEKGGDFYAKDVWGLVDVMKLDVQAELMAGKKLLYVHGFASSGNSGTAAEIQRLLPKTKVYSPDIPVDPNEAYKMLSRLVEGEGIDVVVGTSMGGMFANLIGGVPRILVNPSFHVSRSMRKKIGIVPFFKKRADGATKFEVTEELCDAYEELERRQFENIKDRDVDATYAIFGDEDDVVSCMDEYCSYYGDRYMIFDGGHRLTPKNIRMTLLPVIVELSR